MAHTSLLPKVSFATSEHTTKRSEGSGNVTGLKFESRTRCPSLRFRANYKREPPIIFPLTVNHVFRSTRKIAVMLACFVLGGETIAQSGDRGASCARTTSHTTDLFTSLRGNRSRTEACEEGAVCRTFVDSVK